MNSTSARGVVCTCFIPQQLQGWLDQSQDMKEFLAGQLLPVLLQMAACPAVTGQLRCLAHLVAAQYMARVSPEVRVLPTVLHAL